MEKIFLKLIFYVDKMLASEFEIIKSKYLTEDVFASLTLELFLGLDSSNVREVICKIADYGVKGALNMAWTASQGLISNIDYFVYSISNPALALSKVILRLIR